MSLVVSHGGMDYVWLRWYEQDMVAVWDLMCEELIQDELMNVEQMSKIRWIKLDARFEVGLPFPNM